MEDLFSGLFDISLSFLAGLGAYHIFPWLGYLIWGFLGLFISYFFGIGKNKKEENK